MKHLILLIVLAFGLSNPVFCQTVKPKKQATPQAPQFNDLEKSLDLGSGTSEMFQDFVDGGGLNKINSWYGISLLSAKVSARNTDGLPQFIQLNADPLTTIKKLRDTLAAICKIESWERNQVRDNSGREFFSGNGAKCKARFDNWSSIMSERMSLRMPGIWGIDIIKPES